MTVIFKNYNFISNGSSALRLYGCSYNCASLGQGYRIDYVIRDMYGENIGSGSYECINLPVDININADSPGIYIVDFALVDEQNNVTLRKDSIIVPVDPNRTIIDPPDIGNYDYALGIVIDPMTNIIIPVRIDGDKNIEFGDNLLSIVVYEKPDRTGCIVTKNGLAGCGHAIRLRLEIKFQDDLAMRRYLFMKASQFIPPNMLPAFQVEFCGADLDKYRALRHYIVGMPCITGFNIVDFDIDEDNLSVYMDVIMRIGDWKKFLGHLISDAGFGCIAGAAIASIGGPEAAPAGCAVGARIGAAVATLFHFKDIFEAENKLPDVVSNAIANVNDKFEKTKNDINTYVEDENVKAILLKDVTAIKNACDNALTLEKKYYEKLVSETKLKYGAYGLVGGIVLSLLLRR